MKTILLSLLVFSLSASFSQAREVFVSGSVKGVEVDAHNSAYNKYLISTGDDKFGDVDISVRKDETVANDLLIKELGTKNELFFLLQTHGQIKYHYNGSPNPSYDASANQLIQVSNLPLGSLP